MVAILQSIPIISPLNPISSIAPLVFVISLSMIREAFEDLARYKSDLETNSYRTLRYNNGEWENIEWKDLIVGDIVKVEDSEYFPADVLLLAAVSNSREPELNTGQSYIMTSSLDGEKNLKPKLALKETQNRFGNSSDFVIAGSVICGEPNDDLYAFNGQLHLDNVNRNMSLDAKQLMLRGSQLKNTEYISKNFLVGCNF
jgi:magnesium-transporting ATPase (P-type)